MTDQFQGDKKVGYSILHNPEERLKAWLLPMVPKKVETYHLTLTTIAWSLLILFFSFLAQSDIRWMWLSSLMIVLQYITDLLDGAIGRQRDTGLIKWGYYMDHFLDYIFLCAILIGYSLLVQDHNKYMLFFILGLFGAFMVNSFLSFAATNEFKISYLGIGPTEIRIVFIFVNTVLIMFKGQTMVESALPYVLWFSVFGLFVAVYRTQESIWDLDMKNKYGEHGSVRHISDGVSIRSQEWSLYISKRRIIRSWGLSFLLVFIAFAVLMMRLMSPYDRVIAGVIYGLSWIPFLLSFRGKRHVLQERGEQVKRILFPNLPYVIVALVLLSSAYVAHVLIPVKDTQLLQLSTGDLQQLLSDDLRAVRELRMNMDSLLSWMDENDLLSQDVASLTPAQKEMIRRRWREFANISLELDIIKSRYQGFYQVDRIAKRNMHADAFFIQFAALITQYKSSLHIVSTVADNQFMGTLLDEADAEHSIPVDTYSDIRERLANPTVVLRLNAWACYLQMVKKDIIKKNDLLKQIESDVESVYKTLGKRPSMLAKIPRDLFEKKAFNVWFPFQKEVALQMGRIRAVPRESYISLVDIEAIQDKLQPGDLILERRNWMMSNAGIPGFWPHIALYLGTTEEMDRYFKGVPMLKRKKASEYIRKKCPDAYSAMLLLDKDGYQMRIIEALEQGAVLTSREQSLNADYIGVIRARVSKEEGFKAVLEALKHYGKPYDFNFDFSTDKALVCSELIYKAYQEAEGFSMTPTVLNGRLLITPNFFAEKFSKELGTDGQQLDFVLFIDSSEKTGETTISDVESFQETWKRPKWEILQD